MLKLLMKFLLAERGATAIEYAFIAAGISVAIAGAVYLVGGAVETNFNEVDAVL